MRFIYVRIVSVVLLQFIVSTTILASAHSATLHMYEAATKPKIDGQIDEDVWQHATQVVINNEFYPADNTESDVTATAYMFHNGQFLFVGIDAYDPNPDEIRAIYRARDTIQVDDYIGLVIDTFNDQRSAFEFFLNPLGVQSDHIKDGVRNKLDKSWNAIWQGAGKIHDKGYSVEFAIPLSELRFPAAQEGMTWGIEFIRARPRDTQNKYSSAPKQRGNNCFLCQVPKYKGFERIRDVSRWQVIPTLVANRSDSRELVEPDDGYNYYEPMEYGKPSITPGVDVRWGVTQDNILNLTLNPDFSQVSADSDAITINSSFSASFAEQRDFFLESADTFKTAMMNLVHTRMIFSPSFGAKLTGKLGKHNYGILVTDDDETNIILPSSQGDEDVELGSKSYNSVARYRYDMGQQSNLGVLLTNRRSAGYSNSLGAFDGTYQPSQFHRFTYQAAFSYTKNPNSIRETGLTDDLGEDCSLNPYNQECIQDDRILKSKEHGVATSVKYQYMKPLYDINTFYVYYDDDFRADLGNLSQVGYQELSIEANRKWFGEQNSIWTEWGVSSDWAKRLQVDGQKLEEESELEFYLKGPKRLFLKFNLIGKQTFWNGELYDEKFYRLFTRVEPIKTLRIWGHARYGDTIDTSNSQPAEEKRYELAGEWRIGSHVSARAKLKYRNMDVVGGELYNLSQADVRINAQFNLFHSLRVVLKGTSIHKDKNLYIDEVLTEDNTVSTQFIYAYEPRPKTLYSIGYSDAYYEDNELGRLYQEERTVFMKMSYVL